MPKKREDKDTGRSRRKLLKVSSREAMARRRKGKRLVPVTITVEHGMLEWIEANRPELNTSEYFRGLCRKDMERAEAESIETMKKELKGHEDEMNRLRGIMEKEGVSRERVAECREEIDRILAEKYDPLYAALERKRIELAVKQAGDDTEEAIRQKVEKEIEARRELERVVMDAEMEAHDKYMREYVEHEEERLEGNIKFVGERIARQQKKLDEILEEGELSPENKAEAEKLAKDIKDDEEIVAEFRAKLAEARKKKQGRGQSA